MKRGDFVLPYIQRGRWEAILGQPLKLLVDILERTHNLVSENLPSSLHGHIISGESLNSPEPPFYQL